MAASCRSSSRNVESMLLDVTATFLYGDCERPLFMELPQEDPRSSNPNLVARLIKSLHGSRDAPQLLGETNSLVRLGHRDGGQAQADHRNGVLHSGDLADDSGRVQGRRFQENRRPAQEINSGRSEVFQTWYCIVLLNFAGSW